MAWSSAILVAIVVAGLGCGTSGGLPEEGPWGEFAPTCRTDRPPRQECCTKAMLLSACTYGARCSDDVIEPLICHCLSDGWHCFRGSFGPLCTMGAREGASCPIPLLCPSSNCRCDETLVWQGCTDMAVPFDLAEPDLRAATDGGMGD